MDFSKLSPSEQIATGAGLVTFIATFLPWYGVRGISINAWDSGGIAWIGCLLVTAAAVVIVLGSMDRPVGQNPAQLAFILAGLGLAFLVIRLITESTFTRFGLYLAIVAAAAGAWATYQGRTETA